MTEIELINNEPNIVVYNSEIKLTVILEEMTMIVTIMGLLFICQVLFKVLLCIHPFYHSVLTVREGVHDFLFTDEETEAWSSD